VAKDKFKKTFSLKVKDQKKDSLKLSTDITSTLHFRETFAVKSTVPLTKWDETKMKLVNKDSADVKFTTEYDNFKQQLKFNFKKEPLDRYSLRLFPGALLDYNEKTNDTLIYNFSTNNVSDYGNLRVVLENVKRYPIIVELTNSRGDILASEYSEKSNVVTFDLLEPNKFTLRVIYDDDKDKSWTPGSFLEQRQSEEVIYFPKEIDIRANWDWEQVFDLKNTN
jgi:hypothetical protein